MIVFNLELLIIRKLLFIIRTCKLNETKKCLINFFELNESFIQPLKTSQIDMCGNNRTVANEKMSISTLHLAMVVSPSKMRNKKQVNYVRCDNSFEMILHQRLSRRHKNVV